MKAGERSFSSSSVSPVWFFSNPFSLFCFYFKLLASSFFLCAKTLNTTGFSVLGLVTSWKAVIWGC